MLKPGWQTSLQICVMLLLLAGGAQLVLRRALDQPREDARRSRAARFATTTVAFAREFALIFALLGLWQYVGGLVLTRVEGALERGRQVFAIEGWLHLPSEVWVQSLVLGHPDVVRALNLYYEYAHLNGTAVFVVWMWWRRRPQFPRFRWTLALTTLVCFLVQIVPVAPPRLFPDLGFVDTAALYGQSVYAGADASLVNQVSAMPSVHVAWAAVVAWHGWRYANARWRYLGPAHLVLTVFVVVSTANHWWLDGAVAIAILSAALLVVHRPWTAPRTVTTPPHTEDDVPTSPASSAISSSTGSLSAGSASVAPDA